MIFRPAVPRDRDRLAILHHQASMAQPGAFFFRLGRPFLRQFYKVLLQEPGTLILVIQNEDGIVEGFISGALDAAREREALARHRLRLGLGALAALLRTPSLLGALWARYRTVRGRGDEHIVASGARIAYWAATPAAGGMASMLLLKRMLGWMRLLGAGTIRCEVDLVNPRLLKIHRLMGALPGRTLILPDGRERVILEYGRPQNP